MNNSRVARQIGGSAVLAETYLEGFTVPCIADLPSPDMLHSMGENGEDDKKSEEFDL